MNMSATRSPVHSGMIETKSTQHRCKSDKHPHAIAADKFNRLRMLIDSSATDHFINRELLVGVENELEDGVEIIPPRPITVAGYVTVMSTVSGVLRLIVKDTSGKYQPIRIHVTLAPGIGQHLYSSGKALSKGTGTRLELPTQYLRGRDLRTPLSRHTSNPRLFSAECIMPDFTVISSGNTGTSAASTTASTTDRPASGTSLASSTSTSANSTTRTTTFETTTSA